MYLDTLSVLRTSTYVQRLPCMHFVGEEGLGGIGLSRGFSPCIKRGKTKSIIAAGGVGTKLQC